MSKLLKLLSHRVSQVILLLILEFLILFTFVTASHFYYLFFKIGFDFVGLLFMVYIVARDSNPGYKIAWLIFISTFPSLGILFYLIFGGNKLGWYERKKMKDIVNDTIQNFEQDPKILDELKSKNPDAYHQAYYINHSSLSSVHQNTASKYYPLGEHFYKDFLEDLKTAKKYIFLEFFIINEGKMWNQILEILEKKAKEGITVRVIYDDFGCIMTLPKHYHKILERKGIECCAFNRFIPVLTSRINNRDHRKIAVIDGKVAYTGGINLADEYINEIERFGHWKDTAVRLEGEAVWNFTLMFLTLWNYIKSQKEDYCKYYTKTTIKSKDGYIQPYNDTPLDKEATGEIIYMNMISRAKNFVYITTPYLIVDNEMLTTICNVAKSGVDVRIIVPGIPDKKIVNELTKSYYKPLIESGVHIFEYVPGFIHAKTVIVDGEYATVGTVNFDYRSLYLHFECGVWMYQTKCIQEIKRDFLETELKSCEVTLNDCNQIHLLRKIFRAVLRIFAPLL